MISERICAARTIVCAAILAALLAPSLSSGQTIEERITTLLSRMTVDEKIRQVHQEGGFNTADNARLGIPGFVMADGPHGVRDGLATSFPVSIAMAATWDIDLAKRVGAAMGREFRGKGKHQALGPSMDIDRDPRNGRSPETGGEDPFLCAQITAAAIRGIQSAGAIATAKHYNCNHRETDRFTNNVVIGTRQLIEQAGLPFRAAIQQGGALCVMNAYNLINGQKCAENFSLLTMILRVQWGFPYYVVSDWGSIWNSQLAIEAGCDICMGSTKYQDDLPGLVSSGLVSMAVLDEAVRRVLRTKIIAGMLDDLPPGDPGDINSPAHQALCLEAGQRSLVLLKNDGAILPLHPGGITAVAVVGPHAAALPLDGTGSSYVTPYYSVSPRQGVERVLGPGRVRYAKGCDINSADTSGFAAAILAAQGTDAVLFFGGLDQSQEGEGLDRVGASIQLPGKQQDLINRLAAVNPNVVVVLFSGGICGISSCVDRIRGLVYAFYPGQEGGNAVADVLFGAYNPGGKLPVTMPRSDSDLPAWNDNFNDDEGGGYRWFDRQGKSPQFAFGHGLSYTTYSYTNLRIAPAMAALGEPVNISVDVTNTGNRAGDEVVQVYLSDDQSSVPMPVKQLRGFRRVNIQAGQTITVTIPLTAEELYYFSETTGNYEVEPGSFTVRVGGSSDNLPLSGSFQVADGAKKPDLRVTNVRMVPPFPQVGDSVVFVALVTNQGTGPSPAGTVHKVLFSVDGNAATWSSDITESIPAGGMTLACATGGPTGSNFWIAPGLGPVTVTAAVDPDNVIGECIETNNERQETATVVLPPPVNLALHKAVTVSSVEATGLEGEKAVDGNYGTRWSSAFSDPQYIQVDLGADFMVDEIVIYWEAAYARTYAVQAWEEGGSPVVVKSEAAGDGGIDIVPVGRKARFLKVIGFQRATSWGYSIFELLVHGSPVTAVATEPASAIPDRDYLDMSYPNPFNPSTVIPFGITGRTHVKLAVYSLLGQEVAVLIDEDLPAGSHRVAFSGTGLASGVYLCRLEAGTFAATRKLILLR